MATEYVCSGCGHTFRAADDPADGCPACGASRQRLWSVGTREAAEAPRRAPPAEPAYPPPAYPPPAYPPPAYPPPAYPPPVYPPPAAPPPAAARPARTASPKPPWWRTVWLFRGWRLPVATLRLPALRQPAGLHVQPGRRAAALALMLALWPFPLDDDRLPTPPQGRSATAPPFGLTVAGGTPVESHPAAAASTGSTAALPPTSPAAAPAAAGSTPARRGGAATPDAGAGGPGRSRAAAAVGPGGATAAAPERIPAARTASSAGGPAAALPPAGGTARPSAEIAGGSSPAGTPGRDAAGAGSMAAGRTTGSETATGIAIPPSCLGAEVRRLIFVIDVSVSMGLPHGTDQALENRLDDAVHRGDAEALAQYRALLAQPGASSRLDLARGAFGEALAETPDGIEVGVVSFHGCGDVRRLPPVTRPAFPALVAGVAGLMWHRGGETALSEALREAYAMNAGRNGRIAVITDGKDTCGPPPCQIIEGLRAANPGVRIDVVDVSGRSDAACLAHATGGTFRVAPLSGSVDAFVSSVTDLGRACTAAGSERR